MGSRRSGLKPKLGMVCKTVHLQLQWARSGHSGFIRLAKKVKKPQKPGRRGSPGKPGRPSNFGNLGRHDKSGGPRCSGKSGKPGCSGHQADLAWHCRQTRQVRQGWHQGSEDAPGGAGRVTRASCIPSNIVGHKDCRHTAAVSWIRTLMALPSIA